MTLVYLNTVIRWTRLTRQKIKVGRFFVFIRQYAHTCMYMKRHDLGQYPTELLMTSLVCKVGLNYSSASINQLFNTKNSLLHLLSRKATLKCEVLFKSVFFTQTYSNEIVRRNVKLTREILNLDSKIKHLSPVYKKRHPKTAQTTAKLVSSESKNEPNTT